MSYPHRGAYVKSSFPYHRPLHEPVWCIYHTQSLTHCQCDVDSGFLPIETALPLPLGRYSFPFPPRAGGWVGLNGWLRTKMVYRQRSPILVGLLTGLDVAKLCWCVQRGCHWDQNPIYRDYTRRVIDYWREHFALTPAGDTTSSDCNTTSHPAV